MRPPRPQFEDAVYHVNLGAARGGYLFRDDTDRVIHLNILARVVARFEWTLYSYCLLGTHYHLVFRTPRPNVAAGMQVLNYGYARSFNRRHGGSGHVFEDRYHSELIESDAHLLACVRYVALNPVEAGLCSSPADWPWSSYAGSVGAAEPSSFVATDELLRNFDEDLERARAQLRDFVERMQRFS